MSTRPGLGRGVARNHDPYSDLIDPDRAVGSPAKQPNGLAIVILTRRSASYQKPCQFNPWKPLNPQLSPHKSLASHKHLISEH
jgi:hypothetical protein